MHLNKIISSCLLLQPYHSFIYYKILPEEESGLKLTRYIIDNYAPTPDIYFNLHVSNITTKYSAFDDYTKSMESITESLDLDGYKITIKKFLSDVFCLIIDYNDNKYIIY